MVTLVVGNGFDIAHGLPTQYTDFLLYLDIIKELKERHSYPNEKADIDLLSKFYNVAEERKMDKYLTEVIGDWIKDNYDDAIDLMQKVNSNIWITYFQKIYDEKKMKGENWIDFENEIANVVRHIENNNVQLGGNNIAIDIKEFMKTNLDNDSISKYTKKLIKAMNEFTDMLEQYICFVEKINNPIMLPDVSDFAGDIDNVISFNYTSTFQRFYKEKLRTATMINFGGTLKTLYEDKKINVDFVHGKAGSGNIILGAEETIKDDNIESSNLECVRFKKYFQRISKRTGLEYEKFYKDDTHDRITYIFGHSLSTNDGDIIKYVIENSNKVYIYHHEENKHLEHIENLIKILGKNKVIEYANSKIEFVMQNSLPE